jgi:hypothetical protein
MRSYRLYPALVFMACGGSDWLTGPGTPMALTHESLQGRWVHVLSVHTLVANPSVAYRLEHSPDEGHIVEFDGSGGVQHFRYPPGVTYTSPFYTISGDTLTVELAYLAEVSTRRLELTLAETVTHDFDGDGDQEEAIEVLTYQRGKD